MLLILAHFSLSHAAQNARQILTEWPGFTRGPALDVQIHKNHAYVAVGEAGVMIFDLTNPELPSRIAGIRTKGWVESVALSGDLLVVPQRGWGIRFYDISKPAEPKLLTELAARVDGSGIAIHGNLALVTGHGLEIIDITNPSQPISRGFLSLAYAPSVTAHNNHAFVGIYSEGFAVIDISDPDLPVRIGHFTNGGQSFGIVYSDGYVFLGNTMGAMDIVDVRAPQNPIKVSTYTPSEWDGSTWDVEISGKTAFIAYAAGGLEIADISDVTNPSFLGSANTADVAAGIALNGDYAYVADWMGGLQTFNISDSAHPKYVSEFTTQGAAMGSVLRGNLAVTADGDAGMRIFDLKHSAIVPLASVPTTSFTADLQIRGHLAFLAESQSGFKIVDFSDRSKPIVLSKIEKFAALPFARELEGGSVALMNNFALVANLYGYVHVIDISNPSQPLLISTFYSSNQFTAIETKGPVAFLAHTRGLEALDLTDARRPVHITNFTAKAHAYDLEISGNRIYLPAGEDGLHIFDVSNPKTPTRAGKYNGEGVANGITIAGRYAFITDRYRPMLELLDVKHPDPNSVVSMSLPTVAFDLTVTGNRALLSCAQDGLFMIDFSDVLGPALKLDLQNGNPVLEVTGQAGREFVLEFADDLFFTNCWNAVAPIVLQTQSQILTLTNNSARYYRASWKSE